jgi:hypothetical protein
MPGIGLEALVVLLMLLPGFFAAHIVQSLCTRPQQSEFDKVIEALLYSFVTYLLFTAIIGQVPLSMRVEPDGQAKLVSVETRVGPLLWLGLIALAVALILSFSTNNDLHGRVLRKLRFTQRTARNSVWSDVFHYASGYVQVELVDGRNVLGWLRYYSDTPEESSLCLEDAAWIGPGNVKVPIKGPGILLTKESGIRTIMFLDPGS